jgi:peroxiredoxin
MMRPAPAVGTPAPDFTLATADGGTSITRSTFASGKPLVLIFGSWT